MGTLLLRIAAPIQAWGDESKYDIRGTRNEPTKSGIIGILAAAMGYRRDSKEIGELANAIRFGVRVDQPGTVLRDFHTARAPKYSKNGSLKYEDNGTLVMEKDPYITQRYYLCDACFLVGLECEDKEFLKVLKDAIETPAFSLYLGRRSCPPSLPLVLAITDNDLEEALQQTEWIASEWYKNKYKCIRARINSEPPKDHSAWSTQMDQPVSFNPTHRMYTMRGKDKEQYVLLGTPEHDPMAAL